MTSFRSIALASLLLVANANAHEDEVAWELLCNPITPATCNADSQTPLVVSEYQVVNGGSENLQTGFFDYNDLVYETKVGATNDYAPLSGATGDLTDGIIPTVPSFSVATPDDQALIDPYVGWNFDDPNFPNEGFLPVTFFFSGSQTITSLKVSVNNAEFDIGPPSNVIIGAETYPFPTSASNPYTAEIQLNSPITVAAGDGLDVKITRNANPLLFFLFISKIQFFGCSAKFLACVDQEKARCCHKTDSTCAKPGRRGLQEGGGSGIRKLFSEKSCLWGDEVFSKKSTNLCLQECFAYGERLCALNEDFGLVHECDDSWWAYDGGKP